MFINTQLFREPAIYFQKYGRYDDGEYESYEWDEYWDRERDRCKNGFTVGDTTITGLHYMYLNYLPIMINKGDEGGVQKLVKKKTKSDRVRGFADFWDEDYLLFWTWDIAKEGIRKSIVAKDGKTELVDLTTHEERLKWFEYYSKHLTLPLVLDEYNLMGGKNHLWLKPRGRGASWKGAALGIHKQLFVPNSKTFYVAHEEKFLTGDGIFDKYKFHQASVQDHCSGLESPFYKESTQDLEYIAGYILKENGKDIKKGLNSMVKGVTINGKADNIRGKRGTLIYEEFGSFPEVARTWGIAQRGVEQEGIVFGTQYGFGTGGDDNAVNIGDLTMMFNDPSTYNLLEFTNIYDEDLYGLKSAYFNSAIASLSYKDKDGNSDRIKGKEYLDEQIKIAKEGTDPSVLTQLCAELPQSPSEALMTAKGNIFPVNILQAHKTRILSNGLINSIIVTGRMSSDEYGNAIFNKTDDPIFKDYPIKKKTDLDTAIHIIHKPYKQHGEVPKNLYRACLDPYRQEGSTGDSVGSFYIIENPNKLTSYKGDKIVAWYNARPLEQDKFSEQCYLLAEMYNAKIGIENDETGDFIGYAKRKHRLWQLEEEFELAYDEKIKTKNLGNRKFGMHISSGKDNLRKLQGDKYIQQWLLRERGQDTNGKLILNLHTIYDIGLLEELIQYGRGANYDRISSLRIGTYYEKEIEYKQLSVGGSTRNKHIEQLANLELY